MDKNKVPRFYGPPCTNTKKAIKWTSGSEKQYSNNWQRVEEVQRAYSSDQKFNEAKLHKKCLVLPCEAERQKETRCLDR